MYCSYSSGRFSPRSFAWCLGILIGLSGCARQQTKPQPERIALLRFENLGQDPSADWIGRAIPLILETKLAAPPAVTVIPSAQLHTLDRSMGVHPVSVPGVSAERTAALVAGANRIAYGEYSERAGRLYATLTVEDPQAQKIVETAKVSVPAGDAIGAAAGLARQFVSNPPAFATSNTQAIRAYSQAIESNDIRKTAAYLEQAIAADPDFGPAYRTLAQLDIQRQDRDGALAVLDRGVARSGMVPAERARIQLEAATIRNDTAAKQQALTALTKLEPGSASVWQELAATAMTRHDYATSTDAYRRALQIEPASTNLLNEFGYAAVYAGHLDEGLASVRKYQSRAPNDVNALDSLGDLYLIANRYSDAEGFYRQALKKDPNFRNNCELFKAAMARAMMGDLPAADELAKQYATARAQAHDPAAALYYPQWLALTSRRKEGLAGLEAYARTAESRKDNLMASRAYASLAIWKLIFGDREGAQAMVAKAIPLAVPASSGSIAIARFLAQPSASADEWRARAERFVPNPAQSLVRDEMLAYALVLDRQLTAAKAPLQRLYDATGTASFEGMPVLLAWSNVETGDTAAAAQLLANTPVPPIAGVTPFLPLWFPRIFDLRAKVAEKAGRQSEATQNRDLFHKLSGN